MRLRNEEEYDDLDVMDLNGPFHKKGRKKKEEKPKKGAERSTKKNTKKAVKKTSNREFAVITYSFFAAFICLAAYFCYFLGFQSEDFINSSYNPRVAALSDSVIRGDIVTSDGVVVATSSVDSEGTETRSYPYGSLYAHVVGYNYNGMSGVELDSNFYLLRSHAFILERIKNSLQGNKNQGDTVVTTIDSKLQEAAYDALGDYDGAAIAIDPTTGEILCMVSKPDFDPNTLEANWSSVSEDDEAVLVNRATQGLYPPGSTFKMLTALEYLQEGGSTDKTFDCEGEYTYNGYTIHCYKGETHGEEDFTEAFSESCNVAFSQIGLSLDLNSYGALANQLLFNQTLPTKLSNVKSSSFTLKEGDSSSLVMQTAIGQGETLVTPIHMAMIASAIANNGLLMEPYDIASIENKDGTTVKTFSSTEYGSILTEDEATELQNLMRSVVTDGTGSKLQSDLYTAYGKTGTAEYSSSEDSAHSWFVGYAENGDKKIAIAVVMEGAGSGSSHAVPAAKSVFDTYFSE